MKLSKPTAALALFAAGPLVSPAQAADPPAYNRAIAGVRIVESQPGVPGRYDVFATLHVGRGVGGDPLDLSTQLLLYADDSPDPIGGNEVPVFFEASPMACSTEACGNGWQCASLNIDGVPLLGNCRLVNFGEEHGGLACLCTGWAEVQVAQQLQISVQTYLEVELVNAGSGLEETHTADDRMHAPVPASGVQSYCDGQLDSVCPCGNSAFPGQGCLNSTGAGAQLGAFGSTSVAADDLIFVGQLMPPNQWALLFYGEDAFGPVPFGDGLRCVATNIVRVGTKVTDGFGTAMWGGGLAGLFGWSPGDVRFFQGWYRDPAGPCGSGFNLSNGLKVEFAN